MIYHALSVGRNELRPYGDRAKHLHLPKKRVKMGKIVNLNNGGKNGYNISIKRKYCKKSLLD